jgi:hypothetical protein
MRVARYEEAPRMRGIGSRGGGSADYSKLAAAGMRQLFKGDPDKPGNFEMVVINSFGEGFERLNPRHRHDFDQLRYMITGSREWTPGNVATPGIITYFPAGAWYGPYGRAEESHLHIQFEGPNGAPFVPYDALRAARDELAKEGSFETGAYVWTDEQGKTHKKDGHEANAERATGRPVEYPAPRFPAPVFMDPANFAWLDVADGVRRKELARFTEREIRVAMIELTGTSSYTAAAPEQMTLLFVTAGSGAVDGQPLVERDGIRLDKGERGTLTTTDRLELLLLALPKLPVGAPAGHAASGVPAAV